ncbi:MAG TPA: hypothetical protein VGD60_07095 [Candidatus Acidoferrales bacterium]
MATAIVLFFSAAAPAKALLHLEQCPTAAAPIIGALAGLFILVGLWTPLAGILVAGVELWISFSIAGGPATSLLLAALGASLAMIGPGAWSVDARLFGRKRIETSLR